MLRASFAGLDKRGLRLLLALFFLALSLPTAILVRQAYSQLKWEAFHQHQVMAEELAARVDSHLIALLGEEEARSFADYAFLVVAGDPSASFLQRSQLSAYPVESTIPGLIGYFQVDAEGFFTTPLLPPPGTEPTAYGIPAEELTQRLTLQERVRHVLSTNQLVQAGKGETAKQKASVEFAPQRRDAQAEHAAGGASVTDDLAPRRSFEGSSPVPAEAQVLAQTAFDRLNASPARQEQERKRERPGSLGLVEDLKLDYRYQAESVDRLQRQSVAQSAARLEKRGGRKERSALPEPGAPLLDATTEADSPKQSEIQVSIFESEIDPFEFSLLDSGHFVLFRKVWRDGQRYIQGALIEQQSFLRGMIEAAFRDTAVSRMSDLIVAYQSAVLSAFSGQPSRRYLSNAEELSGALLYQTRLSAPLSDVELIFSITRLPAGAGAKVITWLAIILSVVLCGGFYLMYRLGLGQIHIARQQQDFVSAVSHELKTPLTSIRMYGEMLREGWASEEKRKTYYDYIYHESERLSRLITNVLQLARMTRNDLHLELKPVTVTELMDGVRSKVSSHIERAGFALRLNCAKKFGRATVQVDTDSFIQIVINLVDNAIKFSTKAETRTIDITCHLVDGDSVLFTVRDYGPGVPNDQMKKIFRLFYRSESELTRETVGTGIGLALVHQLVLSMNGKVDVVNRNPGAEFRVSFPAV